MSGPGAERYEADGASITVRRWEGPRAVELSLHARPDPGRDAVAQARAVYAGLARVLASAGVGPESIVREFCFLRSPTDVNRVRAARQAALAAAVAPATLEIGQPPLSGAAVEVSLQALVAREAPQRERVTARPGCAGALRLEVAGEIRLDAAGIHGEGESAYEEASAMFVAAEELLRAAGLDFGDVARTWIHLREMERDYAELNRARRDFFRSRGVDPPPASTGIGGAPVAGDRDLSLALLAVEGAGPRSPMSAPTLNEAPEYGADFARGMRIAETNKLALHVSGTASVDEAGHTVHRGELGAQVDRMLRNVRALLGAQGADFGDIVSGVTYLKPGEDASLLRARLEAGGFGDFPHAIVEATVCRPEFLCETEVLAIRPPGDAPDRPRPPG